MSKEQVKRSVEAYKAKVEMGSDLFTNSLVFQTSCMVPEDLEKKQIRQPIDQAKGIFKGLK